MNPDSLSRRGRTAATTPLRADFVLLNEVMDNHYHPDQNPGGGIPLCIAENTLGWPALRDRLREIARTKPTPDWVTSYTSMLGHPEFREVFAGFLSRRLGGDDLDPDSLIIAAGATATIEMTAFLLGDPDDYAVIPAPAYTAYTPDVSNRPGLRRYDLPVSTDQEHPGRYDLRTEDLDRAYAELGDRFKLLLLTQPNNPTGQVFSEDQIHDAVTWCEDHRVHCVVNEIYALSLIDQDHPELRGDYPGRQWFVSCLPQLERRRSDYFHWWYSFSKDFGVSGFRVGALYTKNEALVEAWNNWGAPGTTSNYTQWLLTELLRDEAWVTDWLANGVPLTESYVTVIRTLRRLGIRYAPAIGSLFVWFDLSPWLEADTDEAWETLWRDLYDRTGLLFTYPLGMGGRERGWFRMVYSGVPVATLREAMKRLEGYFER